MAFSFREIFKNQTNKLSDESRGLSFIRSDEDKAEEICDQEIAKSDEPKKADLILTISSGADVAKDTTVIPIKIFAILNFRDIETADFRSKFPPKINSANPKNKTKNVFGPIFFKVCKDSI